MPIKVLLADESDVMRTAIVRHLKEDPRVEVVGTAANFAQTMQMRADFKPEILLMDLRVPEKRHFAPGFVKSQLASIRTVGISIANDDEARQLSESYGALVLLDKMKLFDELLPAILKVAQTPVHSARRKSAASPSFHAADAA